MPDKKIREEISWKLSINREKRLKKRYFNDYDGTFEDIPCNTKTNGSFHFGRDGLGIASQKVLAKCGFTENGQVGEEGPRYTCKQVLFFYP